MKNKKRIITVAIALVSALLLCVGGVAATGAIVESKSIGLGNAVDAAIAAAGLTEDTATVTKARLSFDNGEFVYDIELRNETEKYDYALRASDGVIVESEKEIIKVKTTSTDNTSLADASAAPAEKITLEAAKQIAIDDSGVTGSVTYTEAKLDKDDGVYVYDIDFFTNDTEFDYEIDAYTGAIREKSRETITVPVTDVSSPVVSVPVIETSSPEISEPAVEFITLNAAKQIALSDAGVTDAVFTEAKLDRDDGRNVYDIDFKSGDMEYDYEIDAITGAIRERSSKKDDDARIPVDTSTPATETITLERAKEIATTDAGVTDAVFTEAKLDRDDGRNVYDIEFRSGDMEYDYEIDATTGVIREKNSEKDDDGRIPVETSTPVSENISLERAKEIAATDAGVSNPTYTTAKLDRDDGKDIFDIEFYTGNTEYDYEIDANTGRIIEKSRDTIDDYDDDDISTPIQPDSKYIGIDSAKKIALEYANINKANAVFKKAKLEFDDGIYSYDIEFYVGRTEYECEIDALTGRMLDFESDIDD